MKKAVALKYKRKKYKAPKVVAKGMNKWAEKIVELAREHNVPIVENQNLVELLFKLEIDDFIPEELYPVVAEILAWVYSVKKEK